MKTKLNYELSDVVAKVADIADGLACTFCTSSKLCEDGNETMTACLDNLDEVASAVCLEDLTDAPAMLMSAARAFRHVFPSDSVGWEHAATLNNAAVLIDRHLRKMSCEPSLTDAELDALEKADPQAFQEFNHKKENPFSNL